MLTCHLTTHMDACSVVDIAVVENELMSNVFTHLIREDVKCLTHCSFCNLAAAPLLQAHPVMKPNARPANHLLYFSAARSDQPNAPLN